MVRQDHQIPFPPPSSAAPANWDTNAHVDAHYASHLEGLNSYQGPLAHTHQGMIDHNAIGDAFLRNQFASLSPTTSTVPTSPMANGNSAHGFFGMLDTQSNAGDGIINEAIEEDKRRRNTAASARFRMKKKEREADLERRTREMTDRCDELQKRISALETENRWLRELITERSRNRGRGRVSPVRKDKLLEKVDKAGAAKDKVTAGSGLRTK